jgi:3-hydroxyisobutyrate dehydrogenase-like beta-hydroxyacid dehydrogenase
MAKQHVGFIGVGLMGHGMARNILEKGHPLSILGHRNRQPVDDLIARGAREAASPAELAQTSDIVFLCVPSSRQVEALIEGENGILAGARAGLIIVDTTTADPNSTLRLGKLVASRGIRFVDAPLARTPKEAEEGRLNVMVGADPELFQEIRPVLETFAENIFHIGPLGAGHKIKLINNFIALGNASIVAEAVTAARKVGIELDALYKLVSAGGANSNIFQMVMPWVLNSDLSRMQFAIRNAQKDLRYFANMANEAQIAGSVAPAVHQTFSLAAALGHGEDFVPQLIDVLSELNGVGARGGSSSQ